MHYTLLFQRREITFLQEQLKSVQEERDALSQKIKSVKDAAKQSLESNSKRYLNHSIKLECTNLLYASLEEMHSVMKRLQSQTESSFTVANEIRASLPDLKELREDVADAINSMQSFVSVVKHP